MSVYVSVHLFQYNMWQCILAWFIYLRMRKEAVQFELRTQAVVIKWPQALLLHHYVGDAFIITYRQHNGRPTQLCSVWITFVPVCGLDAGQNSR